MTESDTQLMERMRDDEESDAALTVLVERYQDELVGFFYNRCWDQAQAEDLAQTVFIKIFQARERYTDSAKVRTYLYRIAHNAWVDYVRRQRRRHAISIDAEFSSSKSRGGSGSRLRDNLAAPDVREDDPAQNALIRERIQEAVEALPEKQRMVFTMANNQSLKYQEISEILDVPEGTIKSRMHAAVRTLRTTLHDLLEA